MSVDTTECFEALLKLESGETLAHGFARLHLAQKAVSFESDFVPLYPMGTPMDIVRLFDNREIHLFRGKVFLSDKRLMKITAVKDKLLPGSERLYCRNMPFSAVMQPLPDQKEPGILQRLRNKPVPELPAFDAPITEISEAGLTFQYDVQIPFDIGQQFLVRANMPLILPETIIEVTKPFWFGQTASYRCAFTGFTETDRANLRCFLSRYHQKKHKLF